MSLKFDFYKNKTNIPNKNYLKKYTEKKALSSRNVSLQLKYSTKSHKENTYIQTSADIIFMQA